jgi:DNA-binding response OmpR family regulator
MRFSRGIPFVFEMLVHPFSPLVLLVDRDLDSLEAASLALRLDGVCTTATFETAEAALLAARELRPAVVVTSLWVPEMCGRGLALALRADTRTSATRILLFSGAPHLAAGPPFDDVLGKPAALSLLVATVAALIERGAWSQSAPGS